MARKVRHLTREQLVEDVAHHFLQTVVGIYHDRINERTTPKDERADYKAALKDADSIADYAMDIFANDKDFAFDVENVIMALASKYVER